MPYLCPKPSAHPNTLNPTPRYGVIPKIVPELPHSSDVLGLELMLEEVVVKAVTQGICPPGKQVGGQTGRPRVHTGSALSFKQAQQPYKCAWAVRGQGWGALVEHRLPGGGCKCRACCSSLRLKSTLTYAARCTRCCAAAAAAGGVCPADPPACPSSSSGCGGCRHTCSRGAHAALQGGTRQVTAAAAEAWQPR